MLLLSRGLVSSVFEAASSSVFDFLPPTDDALVPGSGELALRRFRWYLDFPFSGVEVLPFFSSAAEAFFLSLSFKAREAASRLG